jgi:hypothetical protein
MAYDSPRVYTTGSFIAIGDDVYLIVRGGSASRVQLSTFHGDVVLPSPGLLALSHPLSGDVGLARFRRAKWFHGEELRRRCRRMGHVRSVLDAWAVVLPQRIVDEDLGDYIEDINRRIQSGQRFLAWIRVIAAVAYTGVNTAGHVLQTLGKRTAAK